MPAPHDGSLDLLLEHLRDARGFDASGYERTGLERRIADHMDALQAGGSASYVDYLEANPVQVAPLLDAILLDDATFFRDTEAWAHLATQAIPRLLAAKGAQAPLRAWSAGCGSGAETYTLAMVLAEALGDRAYAERVTIFATDVDDDALAAARLGVYGPEALRDVPASARERFFEAGADGHRVREDVRRTVVFGRNDLVRDPPISRVDLLLCRDTLIYFDADTQAAILRRLHGALAPHGLLVLGGAERPPLDGLFAPASPRHRIFTSFRHEPVPAPGRPPRRAGDDRVLRDGAFEAASVAQLVVDRAGRLVLANRRARTLLRLPADGIGRALVDLETAQAPVELSTRLEEAYRSGRAVTVDGVRMARDGAEPLALEIVITPLHDGAVVVGASIAYTDVTDRRHALEEVARCRRSLDGAHAELESTVGELGATNAELESTAEELTALNEELQWTTRELEALDDELTARTRELEQLGAVMDATLGGVTVGVAVIDCEERVRSWRAHGELPWDLGRESAEGRRLTDIVIGLPVEQLTRAARACLTGARLREDLELPATDPSGRAFACRVTVLPLSVRDEIAGAILLLAPDGDVAV
jgi:two-component system CheB/CheR fusion protein